MKGISLYIHIPFCKSKCGYCDFCSYPEEEASMMDYTRALCDEIKLTCKNKKINTIFIGGGTPTYLTLEAWKILKNTLDALDKDKNIEFTIECNPGTVDEEKVKLFKAMKVNRISIGLQAWQDRLLKRLGRIHTEAEFVECYQLFRSYGFSNINIDIMFGLPDQSVSDFMETVKKVVLLNPEHISCYGLIIEEGTPFGKLYERGNLILPEEDEEREMYHRALEYFNKYGYKQYEISNFSRDGYNCRHNIIYWTLENYIGCGAAAHSYDKGRRYRNEESISRYIEAIKNLGVAVIESKENTKQDDIEEFMFMGLRMLNGVSEEKFLKKFGVSIESIYSDVIQKYCNLGLMKRDKSTLFLTDRGIEVSNVIMSEFIIN